jgi:tetratricopeptide (TPR) repeat protein
MSKTKKINKPANQQNDSHDSFSALLMGINRYPRVVGVLAISALLTILYWISLHSATFITHDDSILKLPVLSHLKNTAIIFSSDFLLFTEGQYRPLSYLIIAFFRTSISSDNTLFWHLLLLGCHALNAYLVYSFARRLTSNLFAPLTAALIFAAHPLCTSMVNDINQFYQLIGITFCLAAINAYTAFLQKGYYWYYAIAITSYIMGLFTSRQAFIVGIILIFIEIFFRKNKVMPVVLRLLPFALLIVFLLPILNITNPHPLHFKYVETHEGSFWHGFYSITGATRQYAGGLFFSSFFPLPMSEIVEKIYKWNNPQFLLWFTVDLTFFGCALWLFYRKKWGAMGGLIILISMIPYASVAYNRVIDYVSWTYLYFPIVGLSLTTAWIIEWLYSHQKRLIKYFSVVLAISIIFFYSIRTMQHNHNSKSALSYWTNLSNIYPSSQIATYQTGKCHLNLGQLPYALHLLFAPMYSDLKKSCLAMAEYYCKKGDLLASAIHLRYGSIKSNTGVILESNCGIAADLYLKANVLDHAEENLGKILMVNPYNTHAMAGLAQVWFYKGYVQEGYRMLDRIRDIDPKNKNAENMERKFHQLEKEWIKDQNVLKLSPPHPDWLNYVLTQERTPEIRQKIIDLSYTADMNDAVIQLEAMIANLENKNHEQAGRNAEIVSHCLSGHPYACAVSCEALARCGKYDAAISLGIKSIKLDSQSELAWRTLALAYALKGELNSKDKMFMNAIENNPGLASMFYYNLGMQKQTANKIKEAAELLQKAVDARPDNVDAQKALGSVLLTLNQTDQSIQSLKKALAIKPDEPEAHFQLGRGLLKQNKNAEGIESLQTAVKLAPDNATYHYILGAAYAREKDHHKAIVEYRRTIELNPDHINSHFALGNELLRVQKLDDSIEEYNYVIKLNPKFRYIHFNLGWLYQSQNKFDLAIPEFLEEIRNFPDISRSYDMLIKIYHSRKEFDQAKDIADQAKKLGLKLMPNSEKILKSLK